MTEQNTAPAATPIQDKAPKPPGLMPKNIQAWVMLALAVLILTISFGFGMINYYNRPLPGIGTSFHNLITDESQFLAAKITQNQLQTVIDGVSDFEARLDSPMWGDFLGTLAYVLIIILLAAAQAVTIVVVAFGFIATAVCVLVGPIFIPFFIVPEMEWLFWGWLKAFIQYAFYQVIAAAVVYIIANLLVGVLRLPPPGTLSTVQLLAWFCIRESDREALRRRAQALSKQNQPSHGSALGANRPLLHLASKLGCKAIRTLEGYRYRVYESRAAVFCRGGVRVSVRRMESRTH